LIQRNISKQNRKRKLSIRFAFFPLKTISETIAEQTKTHTHTK